MRGNSFIQLPRTSIFDNVTPALFPAVPSLNYIVVSDAIDISDVTNSYYTITIVGSEDY